MRTQNIIVLAIVLFLGWTCMISECLGSNEIEKKIKLTKELPCSFQLFSSNESSNLPVFVKESSFWPDETFIKERKMDSTSPEVKESIDSTLYWLKKIIKEQWIPEDIEQRLIPLRESLKGNDAIWGRYQINDYAIQIVADFGMVRLFIRPVDNKIAVLAKDNEGMNTFIIKTVETFLQKSDIVKQKLPEAQETQGIASGIPKSNSKRAPNLWWEQVRWWSDGSAIAFWIPKTDERTSLRQPMPKKHWFSKP